MNWVELEHQLQLKRLMKVLDKRSCMVHWVQRRSWVCEWCYFQIFVDPVLAVWYTQNLQSLSSQAQTTQREIRDSTRAQTGRCVCGCWFLNTDKILQDLQVERLSYGKEMQWVNMNAHFILLDLTGTCNRRLPITYLKSLWPRTANSTVETKSNRLYIHNIPA